MKKNLFTIEQEYLGIMEQIQANEGEITEELSSQLEINETQLQGKSIAYLEIIKGFESRKITIDEEIKRLQAIKKREDNIVKNLKERLLEAVNLFGEFESGLHKFGTRKSSSIDVEDVNSLPKEYKVVKVIESADKKALKEAIKRGEEIEGVELVEKLNLKIS